MERRAFLGMVSSALVHQGEIDDFGGCMVEVVARAAGGSARHLVRCLYTGDTAHVHPVSVRPL